MSLTNTKIHPLSPLTTRRNKPSGSKEKGEKETQRERGIPKANGRIPGTIGAPLPLLTRQNMTHGLHHHQRGVKENTKEAEYLQRDLTPKLYGATFTKSMVTQPIGVTIIHIELGDHLLKLMDPGAPHATVPVMLRQILEAIACARSDRDWLA